MEEKIIEELQKTYEEFLNIEIEYIKTRTYKFYISLNVEDREKSKIKAIEFDFIINTENTIDANINQLKYKINKAIVRLCMKRGEING